MLFFFLACSLTTTPIQEPQRPSGLSDDMQAHLIMQVDNALNIAENDDSIERLYALRDLLSVIKIIDNEDAENLNRYVNQVIAIEEKSTSQEFEIDLSFPDVSNDEVTLELSEQEQLFKEEIESLQLEQRHQEILDKIRANPDFKGTVYPIFVEVRDVYIAEQTELIQNSYTQIISENNPILAQQTYDLCLSLERLYPESNLTVIIDIRYRLQKYIQSNTSER